MRKYITDILGAEFGQLQYIVGELASGNLVKNASNETTEIMHNHCKK
ncbi:hypothetical protein PULV_b0719 [Pseudoalteromonas ulvae UL12]|nr:hypothetical protein [Pseudoalteromonas ulvae UL12]